MTIKNPPHAVEGIASDNSGVGRVHDLPANLAILMIAAGWMRNDTRSRVRRQREAEATRDRRHASDRRSIEH